MKKVNISFVLLVLAALLISSAPVEAQRRSRRFRQAAPPTAMCVKDSGAVVLENSCDASMDALNIDNLIPKYPVPKLPNICGNCSASVDGSWNYWVDRGDGNSWSGSITLNQDGIRFQGTNQGWLISGTVHGNTVKFVMVVHGEEGEGYIAQADGSYLTREAPYGDAIATFYKDSQGKKGLFYFWKPAN